MHFEFKLLFMIYNDILEMVGRFDLDVCGLKYGV